MSQQIHNDVVLDKQEKLSFCCPDYHLVSEFAGLCLSVFVTSDQRMLWFTSFFCLLVLMIYVPVNNFGHVGKISCLLVLNHYQATDKVPCPRTQHCDSGESRPPDKSLYEKIIFLLISNVYCGYTKEPSQ